MRIHEILVLLGGSEGVDVRRSSLWARTACVPRCPVCCAPPELKSSNRAAGNVGDSDPWTSAPLKVARINQEIISGWQQGEAVAVAAAAEEMEFDRQSLDEWAKDKPLSILQLDPADRAVLKIADPKPTPSPSVAQGPATTAHANHSCPAATVTATATLPLHFSPIRLGVFI
ncbi:hypothetical protein Pmani_013654 [Petrolisthes manimaculis]|uniref:Uncharacterized protein n=1 Tax=Petrolisthes manimaculis TaxID=1843537 RepID=A0AAE1PUQ1_9EUCA|nr:hypothetical protein Pmani_013654 [Petrolisthes manimaculis]